jgi:hypothetical protein
VEEPSTPLEAFMADYLHLFAVTLMFRANNPSFKHAAQCRNVKGYCLCPDQRTRDWLLALLRKTAQSVAVITSFMPPGISKDNGIAYHGVTLSSFTSIAMDPHPSSPSPFVFLIKWQHHSNLLGRIYQPT